MTKYLCIHGHFYQPPRENPWLDTIETQESATPYHDWNERIATECYLPNGSARLLTATGKIRKITNNYAGISFNFGATLLSWIKEHKPALLRTIQHADRLSQQQFNGHGNALAQAYNHMIMPLANSADKYTQLYWGIRDFEHFYQRKPEGLWLPETAVDLETLDMMSELGIKFTILAPNQVKHVRRLNSDEAWSTTFSTGTPYQQKLPSGRTITLFFYQGDVAQAVAFEALLANGAQFADRLINSFPDAYTEHTLMHIATDGETYGHHRAYGDMGLAYALEYINQHPEVQLINYAAFLALQPPCYEVEIHDASSWSCTHGVARWQRDCGCNGGKPWRQHWRGPLRAALDWLRDQLVPIFSEQLKPLLPDPWGARNEYITVINDRTTLSSFLKAQAQRELSQHDQEIALKWLELQRYAMLMYNSCAWFFDDLSGIETVQVIKYAAYVIQLAYDLTGHDYEPAFLAKLALAESNLVEVGNGALIYQQLVKPMVVDLFDVSAHLAASLPFNHYDKHHDIYCYHVDMIHTRAAVTGKAKLISGKLRITSKITTEQLEIWHAVFYQGEQNLISAIRLPDERLIEQEHQLHIAFNRGDTFAVAKLFEHYFGTQTISLNDLFYDMRLKITQEIVAHAIQELETSYHQFNDYHLSLIDFMANLHLKLPKTIDNALQALVNSDIVHQFTHQQPDINTVTSLLKRAAKLHISLENNVTVAINCFLAKQATLLPDKSTDDVFLTMLINWILLLKTLPLAIDLWQLQNEVYQLLQSEESGLINHSLLLALAECLNLAI